MTDTVITTIDPNTPEVLKGLSRAEKEKRFISILERGIVDDRLKVALPEHLHGQWVRRDQFSIDRMKSLGYWIDNEYAVERSLHSDGTKTAQVADVIFMVCNKEDHEILEGIRLREFEKNHGKPGQTSRSNSEERRLAEEVAQATGGDIPVINESNNRSVRAAELASTMEKLRAQGG